MGVFIEVRVDSARISSEVGRELLQLCPVNIFQDEAGLVTVVAENEDECTLCELCLDVAPLNSIQIRKLYKDETLASRGKK